MKQNLKNQKKTGPLIITGLSGAGLSSTLKSLEDLGFEAFDNFPLNFVKPLLEETKNKKPLAIGIDARTRGFSTQSVIETAKAANARLIYITCDDEILQKRFTETRRKHPVAQDKPIKAGIEKERGLLGEIKNHADLTIDTTSMSIHDLRHILEGHFDFQKNHAVSISLVSFGFRNGLPREADIVMDVRFLKNPHWDEKLKPKTGLEKDVGEYIKQDENFEKFISNLQSLLSPLIPRYVHEGKNYLTIAIGCTGGKHRSVYCIETLGKWLKAQDLSVHITHRDLKH